MIIFQAESVVHGVNTLLALPYFAEQPQQGSPRLGVVFDIDDTLVCRDPAGREFPIRDVVRLYRACVLCGMVPLVVTARTYATKPKTSYPSARSQIKEVHRMFHRLRLPLPEYLALRPEGLDDGSVTGIARTKSRCRQHLATASGATIVGSVGDQVWDHTVMLPQLAAKLRKAHLHRARRRVEKSDGPGAGCFVGLGSDGRFFLKLPET
ncbi:hypothetical protein EMVG_00127 [Emiliania huxleyi virus PS401]|nr:hypothetical protein EMVG_00127 [Emiliania huxleyi virus PS401]